MTTTDELQSATATAAPAGRHRRNDLPPEGVLADAVRMWRSRATGRGRARAADAVTPAAQPTAGADQPS